MISRVDSQDKRDGDVTCSGYDDDEDDNDDDEEDEEDGCLCSRVIHIKAM